MVHRIRQHEKRDTSYHLPKDGFGENHNKVFGGILHEEGTATLINTTISNNAAGWDGGCIVNMIACEVSCPAGPTVVESIDLDRSGTTDLGTASARPYEHMPAQESEPYYH